MVFTFYTHHVPDPKLVTEVRHNTNLMSPSINESIFSGHTNPRALLYRGLAHPDLPSALQKCRLRDHTMRRRGKCRTNTETLEMMLAGTISSPTSLGDWDNTSRNVKVRGLDTYTFSSALTSLILTRD
jgi:hypothetical protein